MFYNCELVPDVYLFHSCVVKPVGLFMENSCSLYSERFICIISVIISSLSFFSVYFNSSKVNVRPSEPIL